MRFFVFVSLLVILLLTVGCTCNTSGGRVYLDCYGNLTPCEDNVYNLGDPTHQWANLYTYTISSFELNTPMWDELVVNMTTAKAPDSGTPTWMPYQSSQVPAFSADLVSVIYFSAQLPHTYLEGSDLEFHIHIVYPDKNAGDSWWYFTYSWANIGEDFPVATTNNIITASPLDADSHQQVEVVALIDGTGKTMSSILLCSIQRIGTHGEDTYANWIYLLSSDFYYQVDTMGSRTMMAK